jgi:hypothetical protein
MFLSQIKAINYSVNNSCRSGVFIVIKIIHLQLNYRAFNG